MPRRTSEAKRSWVTVLVGGGESEIKDGAVTGRWSIWFSEVDPDRSRAFRGEDDWIDVGLNSLGPKIALEDGESVTRFAVPTTVSSRVFIDDDEDEELL